MRGGACAVTGASGYVGSIITRELQKHLPVVCLGRKPVREVDLGWSLESGPDLAAAMRDRNITTLVHAAWDMRATTLAQMERTSVRGSIALFDTARRAGVERIVFISSISAFDGCRSAYGRTKLKVEQSLRGTTAVVLRPGLVYGSSNGGMFGGIRNQVRHGAILPLIGSGRIPQFLLHEKTLAEAVARAVAGDFDHALGSPVTLAHPKPWPFRDLVKSIAAAEHRNVTLVPVPWRLLYCGIRFGEACGLDLPFRSDSLIGFIHFNRNPDFGLQRTLGIDPLPYLP